MSSRSTTRASSPNATDPSDPLFAQLLLAFVPCSWLPCSATCVFSPGDLLRPIWSIWRGIPGALSTLLVVTPAPLKSSHNVVLSSLVRPTRAELPWYKRMPPWLAVLAWRQRCPTALCSVAPECSATASAHVGSCVCLPAAASSSQHGVAWVVGPVSGKGVRIGGRLRPGQAGERLPKQRPKPCSCLSSASWSWDPSATSIPVPGAEVVGVFFATRRLWSCCKLGPSTSVPCPSRLPWIPATTIPPPCSASVFVPSGASRARSRREA